MLVTILPSLSHSPSNVVRHRFGVRLRRLRRLRQCVRGNDKQIEFTSSFKNYSLKSPSLSRIFVSIDSVSEFSSKKKTLICHYFDDKKESSLSSRGDDGDGNGSAGSARSVIKLHSQTVQTSIHFT